MQPVAVEPAGTPLATTLSAIARGLLIAFLFAVWELYSFWNAHDAATDRELVRFAIQAFVGALVLRSGLEGTFDVIRQAKGLSSKADVTPNPPALVVEANTPKV